MQDGGGDLLPVEDSGGESGRQLRYHDATAGRAKTEQRSHDATYTLARRDMGFNYLSKDATNAGRGQ